MATGDRLVCNSCGKSIEPGQGQPAKCPNCGQPLAAPLQPDPPGESATEAADEAAAQAVDRFADFKAFRGTLLPRESLFQQAVEFATELGPDRVIAISHAETDSETVVTVWYWRPAYEVQSSGP